MKEKFKSIVGFEDYEVSNKGRVRSLKFNKIKYLSTPKKIGKYNIVILNNKGVRKTYQVHQLVAMAFLNHKPNGHTLVVDHIDNEPSNNNINNLQIITSRENLTKDRIRDCLPTGVQKRKSGNYQVRLVINGKLTALGTYKTISEASEVYKKKKKKTKHTKNCL